MSTRERLDRRRPVRTIALVAAVTLVVAALVAAGVAVIVLPPILAQTPRERLTSAQPLTVTRTLDPTSPTAAVAPAPAPAPASGEGAGAGDAPAPNSGSSADSGSTPLVESASITLDAGWVLIGVGPFLPADSARATSPDGVYRLDAAILPAAPPAPTASDTPASVPPIDSALHEVLDDHRLGRSVGSAEWNQETLTSGVVVRYAALVDGDDTVTVAIVTGSADPSSPGAAAISAPATADEAAPAARLVLLARTPTSAAPTYRPVTAALLATAAFRSGPTSSPPTASSSVAVALTTSASADPGWSRGQRPGRVEDGATEVRR